MEFIPAKTKKDESSLCFHPTPVKLRKYFGICPIDERFTMVEHSLARPISSAHPFIEPIITPLTKYFCRNGYTKRMGTEATIVTAARIEAGVTEL